MYVRYYELINKFSVLRFRRSVFLNLFVCLCHKRLLDKIQWIHLWIHWWFYQLIKKFKNAVCKKIGEYLTFKKYWKYSLYFYNQMNLLINSIEFVDEFKWIHWWILMNLLMNSNQFVDEFKSICWWTQMNLLMN